MNIAMPGKILGSIVANDPIRNCGQFLLKLGFGNAEQLAKAYAALAQKNREATNAAILEMEER